MTLHSLLLAVRLFGTFSFCVSKVVCASVALMVHSNIQPIRALLRRRSDDGDDPLQGIHFILPYVPCRPSGKVAVDARSCPVSSPAPSCTASGFALDPGFERIHPSPALLVAFEDFGRRS